MRFAPQSRMHAPNYWCCWPSGCGGLNICCRGVMTVYIDRGWTVANASIFITRWCRMPFLHVVRGVDALTCFVNISWARCLPFSSSVIHCFALLWPPIPKSPLKIGYVIIIMLHHSLRIGMAQTQDAMITRCNYPNIAWTLPFGRAVFNEGS